MIGSLVKTYTPNLIRYVGTAAGAVLVKNGLADADTATAVGGAVAILLTFGWSVLEKKGLLKAIGL